MLSGPIFVIVSCLPLSLDIIVNDKMRIVTAISAAVLEQYE